MNNQTGAFAIIILYLAVWWLCKAFIKAWDREFRHDQSDEACLLRLDEIKATGYVPSGLIARRVM